MPATSLSSRILLIEDDPRLGALVSEYLGEAGYRVTVAATGAAGLERAGRESFDAMVLDLMLPDMDGLDVCKIIKDHKNTRQVPVIMLSGNDQVFDKVMGRLAGASDYITKPFEPETIRKCVEMYCGHNDHVREGLWQKPH